MKLKPGVVSGHTRRIRTLKKNKGKAPSKAGFVPTLGNKGSAANLDAEGETSQGDPDDLLAELSTLVQHASEKDMPRIRQLTDVLEKAGKL